MVKSHRLFDRFETGRSALSREGRGVNASHKKRSDQRALSSLVTRLEGIYVCKGRNASWSRSRIRSTGRTLITAKKIARTDRKVARCVRNANFVFETTNKRKKTSTEELEHSGSRMNRRLNRRASFCCGGFSRLVRYFSSFSLAFSSRSLQRGVRRRSSVTTTSSACLRTHPSKSSY